MEVSRDALLTEISAITVCGLKDKAKSKVDKRKLVQAKLKILKENGLSEAALHPALMKRMTMALQLK
jgi:hypothetical protein